MPQLGSIIGSERPSLAYRFDVSAALKIFFLVNGQSLDYMEFEYVKCPFLSVRFCLKLNSVLFIYFIYIFWWETYVVWQMYGSMNNSAEMAC